MNPSDANTDSEKCFNFVGSRTIYASIVPRSIITSSAGINLRTLLS